MPKHLSQTKSLRLRRAPVQGRGREEAEPNPAQWPQNFSQLLTRYPTLIACRYNSSNRCQQAFNRHLLFHSRNLWRDRSLPLLLLQKLWRLHLFGQNHPHRLRPLLPLSTYNSLFLNERHCHKQHRAIGVFLKRMTSHIY